MPVNARDEQIVREALIQSSPAARDEQIVREAVVKASPVVRNLQIFREVLLIRGTAPTLYTMSFVAT